MSLAEDRSRIYHKDIEAKKLKDALLDMRPQIFKPGDIIQVKNYTGSYASNKEQLYIVQTPLEQLPPTKYTSISQAPFNRDDHIAITDLGCGMVFLTIDSRYFEKIEVLNG